MFINHSILLRCATVEIIIIIIKTARKKMPIKSTIKNSIIILIINVLLFDDINKSSKCEVNI